MINLKQYDDDCFEYHKSVVYRKSNRKNDVTYKNRLEALHNEVETLFKRYSDLVEENNLKTLSPHGYCGVPKADLLSLYRYKSKLIQELHVRLTTTDSGRKFNTCQMCTVNPVGSFDHIVPKEKFPEYSVNPANLFPCCLTCNGKKGTQWIEKGERAFLNLYHDLLPNHQYLIIEFPSYPIPRFKIDDSMLSSDLSTVLKSHYEKLGLFTRFIESSNEIIDPLVSHAKRLVPKMGIEEYRNTVAESTAEMRSVYGLNHWKSLLKIEVVHHVGFEDLLTT